MSSKASYEQAWWFGKIEGKGVLVALDLHL